MPFDEYGRPTRWFWIYLTIFVVLLMVLLFFRHEIIHQAIGFIV